MWQKWIIEELPLLKRRKTGRRTDRRTQIHEDEKRGKIYNKQKKIDDYFYILRTGLSVPLTSLWASIYAAQK